MIIPLVVVVQVFLATFFFDGVESVKAPEEFPSLLAGSFTDGGRFSTGNTLPLIGRPWGFNHWAPQTRHAGRNTGSWWFSGSENTLTWLRCTHQPSPWIGDWGNFLFTPILGEGVRDPTHFWQPRSAVLKPYLLDTVVAPYNVRIELTSTDHAAMVRFTFPESREFGSKRVCFSDLQWDERGGVNGGQYFNAHTTAVHSERMIVNNFNFRVRAESYEAVELQPVQDMLCFKYKADATVVNIRIGTSLISPEQCRLNLDREVPRDKKFDDILQESKDVWHKMMSRVNVLDAGDTSEKSDKHLTIFYTGLYRALTFPRRLDEIDKSGNIVHYSPYDPSGQVHPGYLVTDNGFWDTFRTVYPLLSLIYPDHLGPIVQGWLNAYKEGGWLPSWASPGYRNCMVGTFADVVIADAIVKEVPGFDRRLAVAALSKDAFENAPRYGGVGKEGLQEYIQHGYIPADNGGEVVSRTLDYGFADYSTALAFFYLSEQSDFQDIKNELLDKANKLHNRAMHAMTASFDKGTGLMVPRDRNGHMPQRFSSLEWGKGYTEGNSWHHSFPGYAVSCTLEEGHGNCPSGGLAALHGGKQQLINKLHELLKLPSFFQVGSYGQEIHEMTEMRAFAMGQYGHNNQPVHHILYLFALLGDLPMTQRTVREVLERAYGEDFYAGDEDNGEQGSWYVLSALGLFSVTPGTRDYALGLPLFKHVRILRSSPEGLYNVFGATDPSLSSLAIVKGSDKWVDVISLGNNDKVSHSKKILWNNHELHKTTITDATIQGHGVLQFILDGEETQETRLVDEANFLHKLSSQDIEGLRNPAFLSSLLSAPANAANGGEPSVVKGHEVHNHHGLSSAEMVQRLRAQQEYEREQAAQSSSLFSPIFTIYMLLFVACILACVASEILRAILQQDRLVLDCLRDPVQTAQRLPQILRGIQLSSKHISHRV